MIHTARLLFVGVPTTGFAVLLAGAWRRAAQSWRYQMRLVVTLGRLEAEDSPATVPVLEEVRLELPIEPVGREGLPLDGATRSGTQQMRFHLGESLGRRSALCDRWYLDSTPLLLARDERGAVLCGPGGSIPGAIEQCDSEIHVGWDWDLRR